MSSDKIIGQHYQVVTVTMQQIIQKLEWEAVTEQERKEVAESKRSDSGGSDKNAEEDADLNIVGV